MYLDNNWYGHRFILSRYCGLKNYPAFATIQHGWVSLQEAEKHDVSKRKINFAPYLSWNQNILNFSKKHGAKNIIPIGSPFLYLDRIIKRNKKVTAKGAILFPAHSIKEMPTHKKFTQSILHDEVVKYIEKNFKGPYTVCFFYSDFIKKNIDFYKKRGWNVTCCGSRSENYFLFKLHRIISQHKHIICTDFSSVLLYSMYLQKKCTYLRYLYVNNKKKKVNKKNYHERLGKNVEDKIIEDLHSRFPKLFSKYESSKKTYEFAKNELGFSFIKSKKKLRKLLGWNFFYIILSFFISYLISKKYNKDIKN